MSENAKRKAARTLLSKSGYGQMGGHFAKGGSVKRHPDEAEDKALIKREVSKAKIKLADGGCAEGGASKPRADRLARGGKPKKGKSHTTVNVVVGGGHPQPIPVPKPVPVPVPMGGPAAAAPPPGGPLPVGPDAGPQPGAFKRGGSVKINSQRLPLKGIPEGQFKKGGRTKAYPIEDGAGGGLGRIEKSKAYGGLTAS